MLRYLGYSKAKPFKAFIRFYCPFIIIIMFRKIWIAARSCLTINIIHIKNPPTDAQVFVRTLGQFYSPKASDIAKAVIFELKVQVILPAAV